MDGRPLPVPSPLSLPFWAGTRAGKLLLQCCGACGAYRWTPQALCRACHAEAYEWKPVSGRGKVYSYTRIERPPLPAFAPGYVLAIVELEEGPRMLTNLVQCGPEAVQVGLAVEVMFEQATDEITLYKFRPRR